MIHLHDDHHHHDEVGGEVNFGVDLKHRDAEAQAQDRDDDLDRLKKRKRKGPAVYSTQKKLLITIKRQM